GFDFDGTGSDPSFGGMNKALDDDSVKPGLFPFWSDLRLRPSGVVCMLLEHKNNDPLERITSVHMQWDLGCFADTDCGNLEKLVFGVTLGSATSSLPSSADKSGEITVGFFAGHQSAMHTSLALHAYDPDSGDFVTLGAKDSVPHACSMEECSLKGYCDDGKTPCGFTQVADPFVTGIISSSYLKPDPPQMPTYVYQDGGAFNLKPRP
ncbi:MAG: hypothetical protein KC417_04715, partial [Myxococcales bacterium]|nr:hypothetical protein [Myxococcales bacterium]